MLDITTFLNNSIGTLPVEPTAVDIIQYEFKFVVLIIMFKWVVNMFTALFYKVGGMK